MACIPVALRACVDASACIPDAPRACVDASTCIQGALRAYVDASAHIQGALRAYVDASAHIRGALRAYVGALADIPAALRAYVCALACIPAALRAFVNALAPFLAPGAPFPAALRAVVLTLGDLRPPFAAISLALGPIPMTLAGDDPPDSGAREPDPALVAAARAYVNGKEARAMVMRRVASKMPANDVEDFTQEALGEAASSAATLRDPAKRESWLLSITDNVIADELARRKRRAPYQGPMPTAPVQRDEAGEPIPEDDFASDLGTVDIDPAVDPRGDGTETLGQWARRFLQQEVSGHPTDEQTLAWILAVMDGETTYRQIAEAEGIRERTLNQRVLAFKKKYVPRWKKRRNTMIVLLVLFGLGVAILAIVVWSLLRKPAQKLEDIRPEPLAPPPASASAAPLAPPDDGIFRPAEPTEPDPKKAPQPAPQPRDPRLK